MTIAPIFGEIARKKWGGRRSAPEKKYDYFTVSVAADDVTVFPFASVMMQRYCRPLYLASAAKLSVAVFADE